MNTVAAPSRFDRLEAAIAALPAGSVETVHHFDESVYGRELRIPAGTLLTGKIHKKSCLNFVCGDITVFNDAEGSEKRITGCAVFSSPPGTRRAGFAHRPTIWVTVHPTQETDLEKIEDEVIEKHDNPLLTHSSQGVLS